MHGERLPPLAAGVGEPDPDAHRSRLGPGPGGGPRPGRRCRAVPRGCSATGPRSTEPRTPLPRSRVATRGTAGPNGELRGRMLSMRRGAPRGGVRSTGARPRSRRDADDRTVEQGTPRRRAPGGTRVVASDGVRRRARLAGHARAARIRQPRSMPAAAHRPVRRLFLVCGTVLLAVVTCLPSTPSRRGEGQPNGLRPHTGPSGPHHSPPGLPGTQRWPAFQPGTHAGQGDSRPAICDRLLIEAPIALAIVIVLAARARLARGWPGAAPAGVITAPPAGSQPAACTSG